MTRGSLQTPTHVLLDVILTCGNSAFTKLNPHLRRCVIHPWPSAKPLLPGSDSNTRLRLTWASHTIRHALISHGPVNGRTGDIALPLTRIGCRVGIDTGAQTDSSETSG
jgi:hypothetical protein